jgi:two-component system response regulator YesN
MYSVALVGEESLGLKGLERAENWERQGFPVRCRRLRPADAMGQLLDGQVDVLFADAIMPQMSGIELMHLINARKRGIICVLVFSKADSALAMEAMHEGVFDCCLKTLDALELVELLGRMREALDERSFREKRIDSFPELGYDEIEELLSKQSPAKGRYLQGMLYDSDIAKSLTTLSGVRYAHCRHRNNLRLYLLNADTPPISLIKPTDGVMGLSGVWAYDKSIDPQAIRMEACTAYAESFIRRASGVFAYSSQSVAGNALDAAIDASCGRSDSLCKWLREFPALCAQLNLSIHDVEFVWNQVAGQLMRRYGSNASIELLDSSQMMSRFPNLEAFCLQMAERVAMIAKDAPVSTKPASRYDESANKKLIMMVEDHFAEDISLKDLAALLGVSSQHCSDLFRRHNGVNFTSFLNGIRVEKSKALLRGTERFVSDIAEAVGFSDYFYYNRVFKKLVGETPVRYRKGL